MSTNREARDLENIKLSVENTIRNLSEFQTLGDSAVTEEIKKAKTHLVQALVHILLGKSALEDPNAYESYMKEMKTFIVS